MQNIVQCVFFCDLGCSALNLTHRQESNQTPIGLTTHGYFLISRAAIRLVEVDYSRANRSQVWSLTSIGPAFIPSSSQHLCLCVLAMIDEQPREDEGRQETWQNKFVLRRPEIRFRPEEPSGWATTRLPGPTLQGLSLSLGLSTQLTTESLTDRLPVSLTVSFIEHGSNDYDVKHWLRWREAFFTFTTDQ